MPPSSSIDLPPEFLGMQRFAGLFEDDLGGIMQRFPRETASCFRSRSLFVGHHFLRLIGGPQ
jgi:hypothetical protein